MTQKFS